MRLALATAIIATTALTTVALAQSASAQIKKYDVSGFTRIEASIAYTIHFTQAQTYSVTVESKYNNLDKVIVEKVGDTLRLSRPEGFCTNVSRDGGKQVRNFDQGRDCLNHDVEDIVTITAPDIEALKLHAAVSFDAPKLNVDKLHIDGNAAVNVEISNLTVDTLDVDMSAATTLTLAGTCRKLKLDLGAASTVDTKNLKCREANIDAGVASEVEAYASESAIAHAGISATVLISGHPANFQKSTGRFGSTVSLAD